MPNAINVQPYVFFDGRCEEAIEFYRRALGAEVLALIRVRDSPDPSMTRPGNEDKILHAMLRIGDSTIYASDGECHGSPRFEGFALSLTLPGESEVKRLFAALGDGGKAILPPTKTFFSPSFGMVADRFGVSWMLYVPGEDKPR